MSDEHLFTRLYYYATVHLRMSADEFWLTPIGLFLDIWACHKQWLGLEKPYREQTIDDLIPEAYS